MNNTLNTFQLVHKDRAISPSLLTIREYGTWFEQVFDNYTSQMELYMKSIKKTGETVLEWHPGTRIGNWFDTHELRSQGLQCWYILQDSQAMDKLRRHKLAESRDAIPIAVNDKENRRMLRVYTLEQVELYIKSTLDRNFSMANYVGKPIQIKVNTLDGVIQPVIKQTKKTLF